MAAGAAVLGAAGTCIQKIRVADNVVERVRCGNAHSPSPRPGTLFFQTRFVAASGGFNQEFRKASPEDNLETTLLRPIDGRQISNDSRLPAAWALSPDGNWMAMGLMDRATTNLWRMSTDTGQLQQVTDFGERATWIVRQVTWSHDSKFIYAAIADLDAGVVSIAGVLAGKGK